MAYVIGIDIGTSGTKTILFDENGKTIAGKTVEYPLYTPQNGWAEQDPEDWWRATLEGLKAVMTGIDARDVRGIGITRFFRISRNPLVVLEMRHGLAHAGCLVNRRRRNPLGAFNNVKCSNHITFEISDVGAHGQSEGILGRKPSDNLLHPFLGLLQSPLYQCAKRKVVVGSRQHAEFVFRLKKCTFGIPITSTVQMSESSPEEIVETVQIKNPQRGPKFRQACRLAATANGLRDVRAGWVSR